CPYGELREGHQPDHWKAEEGAMEDEVRGRSFGYSRCLRRWRRYCRKARRRHDNDHDSRRTRNHRIGIKVSAAAPTDHKGVLAAFRDLHEKYDDARKTAEAAISNARTGAQVKAWLVDGRTKTVSSFMKKAFHRGKQYADPIGQITDIAGVRVVVP